MALIRHDGDTFTNRYGTVHDLTGADDSNTLFGSTDNIITLASTVANFTTAGQYFIYNKKIILEPGGTIFLTANGTTDNTGFHCDFINCDFIYNTGANRFGVGTVNNTANRTRDGRVATGAAAGASMNLIGCVFDAYNFPNATQLVLTDLIDSDLRFGSQSAVNFVINQNRGARNINTSETYLTTGAVVEHNFYGPPANYDDPIVFGARLRAGSGAGQEQTLIPNLTQDENQTRFFWSFGPNNNPAFTVAGFRKIVNATDLDFNNLWNANAPGTAGSVIYYQPYQPRAFETPALETSVQNVRCRVTSNANLTWGAANYGSFVNANRAIVPSTAGQTTFDVGAGALASLEGVFNGSSGNIASDFIINPSDNTQIMYTGSGTITAGNIIVIYSIALQHVNEYLTTATGEIVSSRHSLDATTYTPGYLDYGVGAANTDVGATSFVSTNEGQNLADGVALIPIQVWKSFSTDATTGNPPVNRVQERSFSNAIANDFNLVDADYVIGTDYHTEQRNVIGPSLIGVSVKSQNALNGVPNMTFTASSPASINDIRDAYRAGWYDFDYDITNGDHLVPEINTVVGDTFTFIATAGQTEFTFGAGIDSITTVTIDETDATSDFAINGTNNEIIDYSGTALTADQVVVITCVIDEITTSVNTVAVRGNRIAGTTGDLFTTDAELGTGRFGGSSLDGHVLTYSGAVTDLGNVTNSTITADSIALTSSSISSNSNFDADISNARSTSFTINNTFETGTISYTGLTSGTTYTPNQLLGVNHTVNGTITFNSSVAIDVQTNDSSYAAGTNVTFIAAPITFDFSSYIAEDANWLSDVKMSYRVLGATTTPITVTPAATVEIGQPDITLNTAYIFAVTKPGWSNYRSADITYLGDQTIVPLLTEITAVDSGAAIGAATVAYASTDSTTLLYTLTGANASSNPLAGVASSWIVEQVKNTQEYVNSLIINGSTNVEIQHSSSTTSEFFGEYIRFQPASGVNQEVFGWINRSGAGEPIRAANGGADIFIQGSTVVSYSTIRDVVSSELLPVEGNQERITENQRGLETAIRRGAVKAAAYSSENVKLTTDV